VLQGLLALTHKHDSAALERACETALSHGAYRLQTLRKLLERSGDKQQPLPFLDEHPIIRPLDDYAAVVARAIHRQADRPSVGEGFERHDRAKASGRYAHEKSPAAPWSASPGSSSANVADLLPPRPGYPSPGCSSAEPDSVSPDLF
jgi:hypothetical protein